MEGFECDNWDNKQEKDPEPQFPGKWQTFFFFNFLQLLINSRHFTRLLELKYAEKTEIKVSRRISGPNFQK